MRLTVFLLLILLAGCGRKTLQIVETVPAGNGTDRLVRRDWVIVSPFHPGEAGYHSHSLVWQRLERGTWRDHVVITQDAFQQGCVNERWVCEIHCFDAAAGRAILRIAEGDAPEHSASVSYIYSWREWDVLGNSEVRFIRRCVDPFEPFR